MNYDQKVSLRELLITVTKEEECADGKKVGPRTVDVVFNPQRTIFAKLSRKALLEEAELGPRFCTLQVVHNTILNNPVIPAEIAEKRIKIKMNRTRLLEYHFNSRAPNKSSLLSAAS